MSTRTYWNSAPPRRAPVVSIEAQLAQLRAAVLAYQTALDAETRRVMRGEVCGAAVLETQRVMVALAEA